jgi:hypothetical protein
VGKSISSKRGISAVLERQMDSERLANAVSRIVHNKTNFDVRSTGATLVAMAREIV